MYLLAPPCYCVRKVLSIITCFAHALAGEEAVCFLGFGMFDGQSVSVKVYVHSSQSANMRASPCVAINARYLLGLPRASEIGQGLPDISDVS